MPPKNQHIWVVFIRSGDRAAKTAELRDLVVATAGCTILRDFDAEASGFIYSMTNDVRRNPLRSYIGLGARAQVQIQSYRKSTLVVGAQSTPETEEGADIPYIAADREHSPAD